MHQGKKHNLKYNRKRKKRFMKDLKNHGKKLIRKGNLYLMELQEGGC